MFRGFAGTTKCRRLNCVSTAIQASGESPHFSGSDHIEKRYYLARGMIEYHTYPPHVTLQCALPSSRTRNAGNFSRFLPPDSGSQRVATLEAVCACVSYY